MSADEYDEEETVLDLAELKELHDKAYNNGIITRERAADDLAFYWVSAWQDNALDSSTLQFRGEFNILRKAGRQISADLRSNPVQVDFEPKADSRDDGADLLDGLYRSDERTNTSIEAYNNASGESIVAGVGAWELVTEYVSNRAGDENQVIKRKPIYEANNNVFWDPNAKLLDKSDATYVSILTAYSREGYEAMYEELTGEKCHDMSNFANPEESYSFPWVGGKNSLYYVTTFYHRKKIDDEILTLEDPLGQEIMLRKSDLEEIMDDLIDEGYTVTDTRMIKRWQVTKYIASGAEIIDSYPIAGEHIPVVPVYGERAFVEGEEHYEGIVRLAKDPQRLRNFMMSYLADIVSRSPRPKPIFSPEQVQGFEFMYEENGADNSYPYYLMNTQRQDGTPLESPPYPALPEQQMPTSLPHLLEETRMAVSDVANAGAPAEIADIDLSGKAVMALQNRLDQQSIIYQENLKHAKRRDGEIYASMATEVYDSPRSVTITLPDGTRKKEQVMSSVIDKETGDVVALNDLTNMEFEVFADIGKPYSNQKEETFEKLESMIEKAMVSGDQGLAKALTMKQLMLIDGVDMKDIREHGRKQLIMMGFSEPETPEEEQMLAEAQQQGERPDPAMLLAQAEQGKADAQMAEAQRKTQADQQNFQINQGKLLVDQFRAQSDRMGVQIDAEVAGANINAKKGEVMQKRVDSVLKAQDMRARATPQQQAQPSLADQVVGM